MEYYDLTSKIKLLPKYKNIIEHKYLDRSFLFYFENTGNESLIISRVYSSSRNVTVRWPGGSFLPGKRGSIKVIIYAQGLGQFNKRITVLSNSKNGSVTLSIRGTIKPSYYQ